MKRKHARKAAEKILKKAKKHSDYYTDGEIMYARLLLSRLKKGKTQCTNTESKK